MGVVDIAGSGGVHLVGGSSGRYKQHVQTTTISSFLKGENFHGTHMN